MTFDHMQLMVTRHLYINLGYGSLLASLRYCYPLLEKKAAVECVPVSNSESGRDSLALARLPTRCYFKKVALLFQLLFR